MRYLVAAVLAVLAVVMLVGTVAQRRAGRSTGTTLALAVSGAVVALAAASGIALNAT